ncbi:hypothetical protein SDC9_107826 [bioreactor metagenome]|uniref:Uncharacterized protein n=1 Tax=bioreactor metagenome TaxID=1076179 RepID=A0A645B6E1_9ZZZZ
MQQSVREGVGEARRDRGDDPLPDRQRGADPLGAAPDLRGLLGGRERGGAVQPAVGDPGRFGETLPLFPRRGGVGPPLGTDAPRDRADLAPVDLSGLRRSAGPGGGRVHEAGVSGGGAGGPGGEHLPERLLELLHERREVGGAPGTGRSGQAQLAQQLLEGVLLPLALVRVVVAARIVGHDVTPARGAS